MRNRFIDNLCKYAENDESIILIVGDLGFNVVEKFQKRFPKQFINAGICEQSMASMAAGMAKEGFKVFIYSIANFPTFRCAEQIRNDICLHEHKVILLGTSTGYDQGALGATHHKLDDIGALQALPNLRIYSPSGKKSMGVIFQEALEAEHASLIRVSKGDFEETFEVKSSNHFVKEIDSKILIISHGKMITNAINAFEINPSVPSELQIVDFKS